VLLIKAADQLPATFPALIARSHDMEKAIMSRNFSPGSNKFKKTPEIFLLVSSPG